MEEIKPYLIKNFICSVIFLLIIFFSLSSGDGIGGMAVMIGAIAFAVITFTVTYIIIILANNIFKKKYEIVPQIILGAYVCLILFSIYMIYKPQKRQLKPRELQELRLKEIDKTRKIVTKIISESDIYSPNDITLTKDTRLIRKTMKEFFNKSFCDIKTDSVYKTSYLDLLETNIGLDSIEVDSCLKTVYNSIDVDRILYSPDLKKMLVFISFNQVISINPFEPDMGANTLVLIGIKESHTLKLYKFYYESYSTINNPNKESAYYQTFIYLTNHGEYNYFDYPINKKEFWKQNNAFKVHVIDNHKLNEFQIDMSKKATNAPEYLKYSSENPLILKPTFIITE